MGCEVSTIHPAYPKITYVTKEERNQLNWIASPKRGFSKGLWNEGLFTWGAVLGRGKFGEVQLVKCEADRLHYAVKAIPKALIWERKGADSLQNEINIMFSLAGSHPFICHCFGAFQDDKNFCLVLEYLFGGELFNRLRRMRKFPETVARFYAAEIALAISYMHETHQMVYRDLKPENILIDAEGHIRLVDFGFASRLSSSDSLLTSGCGTAMYIAPEIAEGKSKSAHGLPVDWWSLGCVIFEMIAGRAPFGDSEHMSKFEIFNRINAGKFSFPKNVSPHARTLIKGLLTVNPGARFKWENVKSHPWFEEVDWEKTLNCEAVPPWVPPSDNTEGEHCHFLDWKDNPNTPVRVTGEAAGYCDFTIPRLRSAASGAASPKANRPQMASTVLATHMMHKKLVKKAAQARANLAAMTNPNKEAPSSSNEPPGSPMRRRASEAKVGFEPKSPKSPSSRPARRSSDAMLAETARPSAQSRRSSEAMIGAVPNRRDRRSSEAGASIEGRKSGGGDMAAAAVAANLVLKKKRRDKERMQTGAAPGS